MTFGILESCYHKNRLYALYLKGHISKLEYCYYKNSLNKIIKIRKQERHLDLINTHRKNAKIVWAHINIILGRSTRNDNYLSKINANELNNIFANLGTNTTKNLSITNNFNKYSKTSLLNYLFLSLQPKKKKSLDLLLTKNKTSSEFDEISLTLMKLIIKSLPKHLADLCNLSLLTCSFPNKLKIAHITPVFKSGKKDDPINYRPISILPSFSKIFEKVVTVRLIKFLNVNNNLSNCQHGFRSSLNTTTAILDGLNYLYDAIENKNFALGIFLDIAKAFDYVDHEVLLYKLQQYGIRGITLQ